MSLDNNPFDTFVQEGARYGVKRKNGQKKSIIPQEPDDAIENTFDADSFLPNSMKTSKRITARFFGNNAVY